jgi:hypothetical protein
MHPDFKAVIDLMVSLVITWAIGLGIPALLRYVCYRRPVSPIEALVWATGLGLAEGALFVSLGSQSKSHAALILIGWLAYKILQHPHGAFDKRGHSTGMATLATAVARDPPKDSPSSTSPLEPATPASNGEKIGFRFLLLVWISAAACLLASGVSYIDGKLAERRVHASFSFFKSCEERVLRENPACQLVDGDYLNYDQCFQTRDRNCGAKDIEVHSERQFASFDRSRFLLLCSIGLFFIPSILCFAILWALTGRIRPLWMRD